MNWYVTKLVFRIICGDGDHTPQFDEQVRLVHASTDEEALQKALVIGDNEQDAFFNEKNEMVRWNFINVSSLNKLSGLSNGVEIHSSIQESEQAHMYIERIHSNADRVKAAIFEKTAAGDEPFSASETLAEQEPGSENGDTSQMKIVSRKAAAYT